VEVAQPEEWLLREGGVADPACRVVVFDTGLANAQRGGGDLGDGVICRDPEPYGPTRFNPDGTQEITDNRDRPDENVDDFLDPVSGHGTFIASLIARLAPGVQVQVGRVLDTTGFGNDADLSWRIGQLCIEGPPQILSLSLSCYTGDDEPPIGLAAAIALIQSYGTVVVASAGNDSTCRPTFPAALPGVISVAALAADGPAWFTNYGPWVRACAPGVDIVSRYYEHVEVNNPDPTKYEGWASWCGTSFAAPIVAAAVAREIMLTGIEPHDAAERVVDDARLFRLPNLGTVVNLH
jgi:subtilisin family serine protease